MAVSPGPAVAAALPTVFQGRAAVPGPLSLPEGETYQTAAIAAVGDASASAQAMKRAALLT